MTRRTVPRSFVGLALGSDGHARARITYLTAEWSGGGGIGHYAWLLSDGLAECGERVLLATRSDPELREMAGSHTFAGIWPAAPRWRRARLRRVYVGLSWWLGWFRLVGLVASHRRTLNAFHLQGGDRVWELPFLLLVRALKVPVILTAHNAVRHDSGRAARAVMKLLYRTADGIVVHTDETRDDVRRRAGNRPRIIVIRHPRYTPIVDHFSHGSARKRDATGRVTHLGMIRPYKGFGSVVAAIARVRAERPDVQFAVAGRPSDPVEVERLLGTLPAAAVTQRLGYLDIRDFVAEAIAADVVMLGHSSQSESGVAHLALGAGTAVVGPRTGAIERLLRSEPDWLYEPGDDDGAAEALRRALDAVRIDPERVHQRARRIAEEAPTWVDSGTEHLALVRAIRGSQAADPRVPDGAVGTPEY